MIHVKSVTVIQSVSHWEYVKQQCFHNVCIPCS